MKQVIENGNYRGYYKFRGESNERVKVFQKEWFQNKVCLDIGCNEGLVTLEIAKQFIPKSILGIDIDKILIESAQSKLKRIIYDQKDSKPTVAPSTSTVRLQTAAFVPRSVMHKNIASRIPIRIASNAVVAPLESYPHNIHFICKRFVDLTSSSSNTIEGLYDTVLCLSVVKWIHLNEGDAGLMEFFNRLFHLLRFDGRLILEFQPWKSYINNKAVNEKIKANFNNITIRPEQFERILVDQVGFVLEANLGPPVEEAKGFQRPIFVLRRPTPGLINHVTISDEVTMSVEDTDVVSGEQVAGELGINSGSSTTHSKKVEVNSKKTLRNDESSDMQAVDGVSDVKRRKVFEV